MTHANRPGLLPKTSRLLGLPVLAALPIFILAMGTEVLAQQVSSIPTPAAEDLCQSSVETEQRQCAAQLAAAIRVARARADAKMLDAQAQSLEDLVQRVQEQEAQQGNKGLTDRVCDVDCTIERASVRLYRANDFPVMGTKPSSETAVDGDLLAQIMDGLRFVEHGLLTLPRRKGSYNPAASTEAGFKHYLEGLAALSALKVRLLMAGGDLWYRAASASTVRTVGYAVGEATGSAPTSGGELELQKAQAFYEEAFWAVVEAETGVPVSSGYGDILLDLRNLRADLSQRLDSVQRGFLFLGVDPEQQTRWTLLQVGEQLRTQASALELVNDDIESTVKEWAARKDEYNQRGIDLERYASSKAIEAEVYRLAELQNAAQGRQSALEREIDSIANGLATVDEQLRADQILATLERERLELSYELGTIDKQTTQDLLALNKETISGQLEAVGARIEKTLADYNFEMQLQELNQRKISLETDLQTLNLELAQIGTQQTQASERRAVESERIAIADSNIRQLTESQGKVFELHQQAMQKEIAGIDEEIAYLERSASSLDAVCRQRADNKTLEGKELQKVIDCIESGCEGGAGLKEAYDKLFEKNNSLLDSRKTTLTNSVSKLKESITAANVAIGVYSAGKAVEEVLDAMLAAAETTRGATSAALQASTAGLGAFAAAGIAVTDAAASAAVAMADFAVRSAGRVMDAARFDYETLVAVQELERSVTQANSEASRIDVEKEIEDWSHKKFLTEVGVDLARTQTQIVLAEKDKVLGELECNGDKLDLERAKAKQTSAKQVLVAQMAAKQAENALLTYDVEEQRHLQDLSRHEIARLSAESAGLDIEKQQTQARINSTNTLLQAVAQQRSRVEGYRAQVNDLTASQQSLQAARDELNERVKQGVVALAEDHKQFVTAALESAEKAAKQQLSRITEKIAALSRQQKVTNALAALEQELVQAVSASNNRILGLIEKDQLQIEAGQAKMVATFWDYEGMLSKMTRGMPEVLARKRSLLENVNFWYNLYRNRYRLLSGFASDVSAASTGPVFLTQPDQVRNELGTYCIDVGPNELCRPNSLALSGASIVGKRALFTLDRFDSLAVQLADDGTARFEISPSSATRQGVAESSGRVLWKENMNPERPLVLLDAAVFADGCVERDASHAIRLSHLGFGTQVRPYGDSTLVEFVSRSAAANADLVLLPDTDTASAASAFDGKSVPLSQVEYLLRDIHDAGFPLFGYPVVAHYELRVEPELQLCLSQKRPQLKIKIVFAN